MVTKSKTVSRVDEISGLSDDLLVKILSYLPTKVAVSTSILSKRWECVWMWLPKLDYSCTGCLSNDKSLRCFIHLNLALHRAPVIETFHLKLYSSSGFKPEDIKLWLVVAISRFLRHLEITYRQDADKPNVLPSNLYTCKSLVTLKLIGTIPLDVPRLGCLPSLKTLQLCSDRYFDGESLKRLLSICPVLEDLFVRCDGSKKNKGLVTVIVPSLLSLTFHGIIDGLVINTPSLKYLLLGDLCKSGHRCEIENMPNLENAYVAVTYSDIKSLIRSITSVKRLSICSQTLHSEGYVFNQLEHLEVCVCALENPTSLIARFIEDSPNLRVLDINNQRHKYRVVPERIRSNLKAFKWSEYLERRPQERDLELYIFGKLWSPKDRKFPK